MVMIKKLRRETLTEQAEGELLHYIRAQGLQAGASLPSEARLAEELSVSRPVVREALKSLQGQGVISIVNGRGSVVRPVDGGTLRIYFSRAMQVNRAGLVELQEVRKGIEMQSAHLAAQRRTAADIEQLALTTDAMRDRLHEPEAYADLDVALHLQIAAASHNSMLYHLVESLHEAAKDSVLEGLRRRHTAEQLERVQELHERIVQEVEKGDAARARQWMEVHFDEAVFTLLTDEVKDAHEV